MTQMFETVNNKYLSVKYWRNTVAIS